MVGDRKSPVDRHGMMQNGRGQVSKHELVALKGRSGNDGRKGPI